MPREALLACAGQPKQNIAKSEIVNVSEAATLNFTGDSYRLDASKPQQYRTQMTKYTLSIELFEVIVLAMNSLALQTYLRAHSLNALKSAFGIRLHRHSLFENLICVKYSQYESPMEAVVVQQCRGIILDESED